MYETCEQMYSDGSNFPEDLLKLSEILGVAYDLTNSALVNGWETTTRKSNTLRLLRNFRKKLDRVSTRRYDDLRDYNLGGRAIRWNFVSLIFMLKCNVVLMERNLYVDKPLDLESKKALVRHGVLTRDRAISEYTQIELYEAVSCLTVNWHDLTDSPDIWKYIEKLEARAAVLIVEPGGGDVLDGPDAWRKAIPEEGEQYTSSHEYVSDLATLFTLFSRSRSVRELVSTQLAESVEITARAGGYDLNAVSEAFVGWIEAEIEGYQESSFKSQLKKTINTLCGFPGEPERYARDHQGIRAKDIFAIIEHSRPPLQVAWWTSSLGKGAAADLLNRNVLGSYPPSVVMLKIFHCFCESRVNGFKWWNNSVVMEHDVYSKLVAIRARVEPLIIQHMGEFNVLYKKKFFRTRSVEMAIVLWIVIIVAERGAKFKLLNNVWDLSKIANLLDEWNRGPDEMEIDHVEGSDAMIEIDA